MLSPASAAASLPLQRKYLVVSDHLLLRSLLLYQRSCRLPPTAVYRECTAEPQYGCHVYPTPEQQIPQLGARDIRYPSQKTVTD